MSKSGKLVRLAEFYGFKASRLGDDEILLEVPCSDGEIVEELHTCERSLMTAMGF